MADSTRGADGRIPVTTYRLDPETLAALDRIAARLSAETGAPPNRTAAIRFAARMADQAGKKKSAKSTG